MDSKNVAETGWQDAEQKQVQINNWDIPLLSETLYIMQMVCVLEKQLQWQRARISGIRQNLTGMPHGNEVARGLENALDALLSIEEEYEAQCKKYVLHMQKAQKILNSIESRTMRTFVLLKYVMNMPDAQIRNELNMTRRGFDRAKKAVEEAPSMAKVKWKERYFIIQEE